MGVREDLIAAKALIDTPEKWENFDARRRSAGGVIGHPIDAALLTVTSMNKSDRAWLAKSALRSALPDGFDQIAEFAPTTTHADIMALFDRAIAKAGASHV